LDALAETVENLRIPLDGAALARAIALRDQLDARIAETIDAFDRAELWDLDAATSMTAWLRHHTRRTPAAASQLTRTARRLRSLPALPPPGATAPCPRAKSKSSWPTSTGTPCHASPNTKPT
jgi:hypothetical protein